MRMGFGGDAVVFLRSSGSSGSYLEQARLPVSMVPT